MKKSEILEAFALGLIVVFKPENSYRSIRFTFSNGTDSEGEEFVCFSESLFSKSYFPEKITSKCMYVNEYDLQGRKIAHKLPLANFELLSTEDEIVRKKLEKLGKSE